MTVFVFGCYDYLDVQKVRFLKWASSLGDVIVGLRTDDSVKARHGLPPELSHFERAEILMEMSCVKDVFMFDESSPSKLIRLIAPSRIAVGNWQFVDIDTKRVAESLSIPIYRSPIF